MIPVRSVSMCACHPVGSSLIFAGIASAGVACHPSGDSLVLVCLLMLPLAFLPVYWARDLEIEARAAVGNQCAARP